MLIGLAHNYQSVRIFYGRSTEWQMKICQKKLAELNSCLVSCNVASVCAEKASHMAWLGAPKFDK